MKTSISVTNANIPLPMVMFRGELDEVFKTVSEIGYQAVELFLETAEGLDVRKIKEPLERYQLKVGMFAAMSDLVGEDITMAHPDAAVRQRFLDRAPGHLKLASTLDALVPVGLTRGKLTPGQEEATYDWFLETLEKYGRMAHEFGVILILEPINRHEVNFIHRTDEALTVIETLNLPNLKLLLDSYHLNIEEASIPLAIVKAGHHIGHFHFVDSNRWPPGYGHADMKEIFRCLKEVDYQGLLAIEAIPKPDAITGARGGLEYIRMLERMWEESKSLS